MVLPDWVLVLSINWKTDIQVLGQTQKGLLMKSGQPATMMHDYKRNETATLFVALNTLNGKVIGRHAERHRHQEFIAFLDQIDKEAPVGWPVHAILDNYAARPHVAVKDWLAAHRHWTFYYTPNSCFWMNVVEVFFGKLARNWLRCGVRESIEPLETSIQDFIVLHNEKEATAFKWTASLKRLIATRQIGCQITRTGR